MKKFVEVQDTKCALESMAGEVITLFCLNYIYTGKLTGINEAYVELTNPSIVYETGAFDTPNWKDAQKLPENIYVMLHCVESFGRIK